MRQPKNDHAMLCLRIGNTSELDCDYPFVLGVYSQMQVETMIPTKQRAARFWRGSRRAVPLMMKKSYCRWAGSSRRRVDEY